jgi:hypothetical protein
MRYELNKAEEQLLQERLKEELTAQASAQALNDDLTLAEGDVKKCAVRGCSLPVSGPNNLCDEHRLPGVVVCVGNSTRVVTAWTVEHGDESGIIFINDRSLANLFGGRAGFEKRLGEQGFTGVRNIRTPEELESAKDPANGKKWGSWDGAWRAIYPWEKSNEHQEGRRNKDKCRACGIAETETPAGMVPGLYICSQKCAQYLAAHPELNPITRIDGPDLYGVKWPDEPNGYQVRAGSFKDGSRMYACPCRQAPNPKVLGMTAYVTGMHDMSKACRHIGLVILFEQSLPQRTRHKG